MFNSLSLWEKLILDVTQLWELLNCIQNTLILRPLGLLGLWNTHFCRSKGKPLCCGPSALHPLPCKSPHFLLPLVVLTIGSAAILFVPFPPFHFNWFWSVKAFSEYEFVSHWNQSFSASLLPPSFNSAKSRLPQIKWLWAEPALTWLQSYIAVLMLLIWLDPVWPRNASLLKGMVLLCWNRYACTCPLGDGWQRG